MPATFQLDYN